MPTRATALLPLLPLLLSAALPGCTLLAAPPTTQPAAAALLADPAFATLALRGHPLAGRLVHAGTQAPAGEADLLRALAAADVAILGETHDNPAHHALQARLLGALLAAGRRPALVFEQIDVDRQGALADAQRLPDAEARIAAIGAAFAHGWDWPAYRPLVAQAVAAGLPVHAGNLARGALRPLVREGWPSVAAGERARLAVEAAWNDPREAHLRTVIEDSHCGQIDEKLRDGLVRAQRLRDATLADAVLAARGEGAAARGEGAAARPVVLITGRGHARHDVGVPRYLAARAPALRVVSLGIEEVAAGQDTPDDYLRARADALPHDYLWFTPRFERPDPCANFGK